MGVCVFAGAVDLSHAAHAKGGFDLVVTSRGAGLETHFGADRSIEHRSAARKKETGTGRFPPTFFVFSLLKGEAKWVTISASRNSCMSSSRIF